MSVLMSTCSRAAKRITGLSGLAAVTLGVLFGAAQAQTLTNGSFEGFSGSNQQLNNSNYSPWQTSSGYTFIVTPSQAINGFGGGLQLYSPTANSPYSPFGQVTGNGGLGTIPITSSPDGGSFLAVDPSYQNTTTVNGNNNTPAATYQTITNLVNGYTYTVSFWAAAGQQKGFNLLTTENNNWTVAEYAANSGSAPVCGTSGEQCQTAGTISVTNHAFSGWVQQQVSFVANATSMTLAFIASSNVNSGQPPFAMLDGVTVSQNTTVPEPATAAMLLAGLGGLVAARRRARVKA
jgi:hypothetical protein